MIEIVGQGADGDQAVGTAVVQRDEEAEAGDAVDPAVEARTDTLLQEGGGEAVDSVALGGGGAALGRADVAAHLLEEVLGAGRQAVLAQLQTADQSAVYQQIDRKSTRLNSSH